MKNLRHLLKTVEKNLGNKHFRNDARDKRFDLTLMSLHV